MRKLIFLVLIVLFAAYAGWAERRPVTHYLSDLRSQVAFSQGVPSGRGNLLGIQPELFTPDYQSVERLRLKLAAYLEKARSEGLLGPRTVVVFPEHIGTWLLVTGEKPEVYRAERLDEAMEWMIASNPLKLARGWLGAKGEDRMADALLRMKSVDMAHDYQTLFGGLAREFGVTVVAGSIVLPSPRIDDGVLVSGNGRLFNVSLVFGSDGLPIGKPQRKVFLSDTEKRFIRAGNADDLQVLSTPAGRLGVLIGADSWHADSYAALSAGKAEIVAVPASHGRNDGGDWNRLELNGGLGESGAQAGMAVFLRGRLWDLRNDGRGLVATQTGQQLATDEAGARLINLWL
ncbi:hypothetical protein D9M71_186650 [compost metagenome]